jgi:hypothetical protein
MDLWKSIEQAYYAEEQDGRRAVDASDISFSYEAITAEWLTNVLGKTYPGVSVLRVVLIGVSTMGDWRHGDRALSRDRK